MTVGDLIALLETLPADVEVMLDDTLTGNLLPLGGAIFTTASAETGTVHFYASVEE